MEALVLEGTALANVSSWNLIGWSSTVGSMYWAKDTPAKEDHS